MRIRIKFAKKDRVKYIGHLDILRFFQRCFNRAEIKMEYSIGFNPHQKMSFAQPLGVGIISRGEYLDAEIADGQDLKAAALRMNEVCGDGFEVISIRAVEEGAKKAMAALRYADYRILLHELLEAAQEDAAEKLREGAQRLLSMERIPVIKRTKSGEREVDIRPQIIRLEAEGGELRMRVTAASDNNLKAETLVQRLFAETDIAYDRERITICREELLAEDFISLEQFQTIL